MNVEEFLSTLDALRFDTNLDDTYPELRGMIQKVYPYIRKIYNMMYESGYLAESKINEFKSPVEPSNDYEGNDLNYENIYDEAYKIVHDLAKSGMPIKWVDVANRMGFHIDTLNEADMELLHDAIEDAMSDIPTKFYESKMNEETFRVMFDSGDGKDKLVCGGFKTEKEAQSFIESRPRPENYYVAWGEMNESKKNSKKVSLTESKLNSIIAESIKRAILKEGFFDSFPSMYEKEEKKDDDSTKEKEGDKTSAKRRERVISRLKSDGVDVAQYAYRLWPDKDEDSARSYFYKCLDGKTNDTGDVYKFTSDEINRLYSMLANDEL